MLSKLPIIYWDACVPLSYINGTADRLPTIEALMQQSGKDCQLITSVFCATEVAFAKVEQDAQVLEPQVEEKISTLWQVGSPIQLVEFYEVIAVKAQKLIRAAIPKGWSLKPGDAIHLATAGHLKVRQFHTYDDSLDKYEELTETHFEICRPTVAQAVIIFPEKATGEPNEQTGESRPKEAVKPIPAKVSGSDSGRAEGQTGAEKEKIVAAQTGTRGEANPPQTQVATPTDEAAALADQIVVLHKNGTLPTPFVADDVRKHFEGKFSDTHINTVLANYSEETGDQVKRGRQARFKRVDRGKYHSL